FAGPSREDLAFDLAGDPQRSPPLGRVEPDVRAEVEDDVVHDLDQLDGPGVVRFRDPIRWEPGQHPIVYQQVVQVRVHEHQPVQVPHLLLGAVHAATVTRGTDNYPVSCSG